MSSFTISQSIRPLALFAAQLSGAEGYVFYERDPHTGDLSAGHRWGVDIPETLVHGTAGLTTAAYHFDGPHSRAAVLALAFRDRRPTELQQQQLDAVVGAIRNVWSLHERVHENASLAARIEELEGEIVRSKIANRVEGLVESRNSGSASIPLVLHHVEAVLRSLRLGDVLRRLTAELEDELAARNLASRAKEVLQRSKGMSEEEAHTHLRLISRKTRRPLRDVARSLAERA